MKKRIMAVMLMLLLVGVNTVPIHAETIYVNKQNTTMSSYTVYVWCGDGKTELGRMTISKGTDYVKNTFKASRVSTGQTLYVSSDNNEYLSKSFGRLNTGGSHSITKSANNPIRVYGYGYITHN